MSFDLAVEFTIDRLEGGWVETNRPDDPGGDTYAGVTRRAWQLVEGAAASWPPTREEVLAFYEREYWDAARCGDLPEPLDAVLFQLAVNCGVGEAVLCLHAALGIDAWSMTFGPQTETLLDAWRYRTQELCGRLLSAQRQRYQDLRGPDVHGQLDRANVVEAAVKVGLLQRPPGRA